MKRIFENYGFLILVAGIIYVFDQVTKVLVRVYIPPNGLWSPWSWLTPYARLVHISNSGAAFGMLQGFSVVFTILAVVVALAILYYFPQVPRSDWLIRLAMSMQFAGALGNLTDRIHQGGEVTDFISVGTFAVFNVADASISVGVALLILAIWLKEQVKPPMQVSTGTGVGAPNPSDVEPGSQPLPEDVQGERPGD